MVGILTNSIDMEKVKQWAETLQASNPWPRLAKIQVGNSKSEGYQSEIQRGKLKIVAEGPIALAVALTQLEIARKANHLSDFLGEAQPQHKLRPLWIEPQILDANLLDRLCERTLELGYNSWIIGKHHDEMFSNLTKVNYRTVHSALKSYGIKLIVKPELIRHFEHASTCPLDTNYQKEIKNLLSNWIEANGTPDYLFWRSLCHHPGFENASKAKESLRVDLAIAELKVLEAILKGKSKLVYYLPSLDLQDAKQQSTWMKSLCNAAEKNTIFAFSALAGSPFEDHLIPHPFWEEIRKSPIISQVPLLPILNCGAITQGEGLWPNLPLDLIQTYVPRTYRTNFIGIAIPTPAFPTPGSILDANLWIASQMQWRKLSVDLLAETWFSAYHPKISFNRYKEILENLREVSKELSHIRSIANQPARQLIPPPDCRTRIESIIAHIKHLDVVFQSLPSKNSDSQPSLSEYYPYFSRDAKKMLSQLAQHLGVPTPHLMQSHDQGEGFWTDLVRPEGVKSWMRQTPRIGEPGSTMDKILRENRFNFNE